tara:strand:- start:127 stop:1134 length:1008 start_codon:yes stop_codon:yes gene_type:complete
VLQGTSLSGIGGSLPHPIEINIHNNFLTPKSGDPFQKVKQTNDSNMAINAQSISTYISDLEKDNAALRKRVTYLEEIRDSLLRDIVDENAKRWDDYLVEDDESVGSDSEEYESDSDSDSSTMAQITGGEPYESDSDATTVGKPAETEETDHDSDYEADSDCDYFISYNYDMTKAFDDLAAGEENEHKKRVYQKAANNIFHYPSKIKYGEQITHMSGIGKGIIRKINEFLETGEIKTFKKFERNEDIAVLLEEYAYSAENPHRSEACEKAANAIRNLHFEVTSGTEISQGPRKVPGIGKGIANKIDEYIATGPRMLREDLDENLGRLNIGPRRVVK